MLSRKEIEAELPNYYGTIQYWRYNFLGFGFIYTDGAKFIFESCDAYWLRDHICTTMRLVESVKNENEFLLIVLSVNESNEAVLSFQDGNTNEIYKQVIEFTDFPLPEIKFYYTNGVLLLPSEY